MTDAHCQRLTLDVLTDYAAGELSAEESAAVEEHVYVCASCGARAAEVEAIAAAIAQACRLGQGGGIVTDALLNQLARDGVRVRTFALSPGDVVPCAVWEGDELMVLRLRGNFAGAGECTMTRRVGGVEVSRTLVPFTSGARGELLVAEPAALLHDLPVVHVEIVLSVQQGGQEREVGRYTLAHGGSLHRG